VTALDWIIVVFTLLMALWGYNQGLIVGALSLAGFVAGAFIGSRLGPLLLSEGDESPYAPLFALGGALLLGGFLASSFEMVGFRLRVRLGSRLGALDGVGGGVLLACLALGLAWIGGAVALQTPGANELRSPIQRSAILGVLNDRLPPTGPILQAFARFDPFPQITGPQADVPEPTARIARDPQVRAAGRSVVRVLGTACGLGVQGSGWVAGDGTVVTNAHVVAGQDDTTVQVDGEGARLDADAIWFDSHNDLAVLRVPGLSGVPALRLNRDPREGASAAILGYPENGPFHAEPGRLGHTATVISQDAYGDGPVRRAITSLRGRVRQGNSGGPMVDGRGRVVTTIFAATVSDGGRSGYGVPDEVVADALERASGPVDTGPCAR
jgi:S1-C subfamily serine protease